jgi:hypothetical protein
MGIHAYAMAEGRVPREPQRGGRERCINTMQNLKAVAMGVVAAIAFFGPNRPNPAIPVLYNRITVEVPTGIIYIF